MTLNNSDRNDGQYQHGSRGEIGPAHGGPSTKHQELEDWLAAYSRIMFRTAERRHREQQQTRGP